MRETGFHPRLERALIVVFLLMLVVPPLGTVLGLQRATPEEENRPLASFPALQMTWASWRAFPDAFTRYFEDNFAFRPALVRWQAAARVKALDVSPSTSVVKGRDGWWFYADDGAMQDYAEVRPFTGPQLQEWRHALQDTSDWLAARGIAYLFVLAPDKHQVYPEYMPAAIRPAAQSRMDQLVDHLARHSTVRVLDLRPALGRAKAGERIYHRTDTHWNDLGAFVAYTEIIASLSQARPDLRPMPAAMFSTHHARSGGLDLARMMRLTSVLEEDEVTLEWRRPRQASIVEPLHPNPHGIDARIVTTTPAPNLPRAVVFRDSFASAVIPFLAEHFSRALYLWQHNVDPVVVASERPDVVVHEIVGRRLSTLTPYNPFAESRLEETAVGISGGSD